MLKGFFLVLTVLGLSMAAFGIYFIGYSNEATSWPSVEGRIVQTTVRAWTPGGTGRALTPSERQRRRRFYPEVTYQWTVNGQSFTGSRYSLGESQDDHAERAEAVEAARRFPAGGPIEVFYDPDDPSSAVLNRARQGGAYVPLPLGLLMLGVGLAGLKYLPQLKAAAATSSPMDID